MENQDIVIIGGGASAVSFLCQLEELLEPTQHLKVTIFEKSRQNGLIGYAYSCINEELILNTPADIMGVSSSNPYSFYEWLIKFKGLKCETKFVPRYLFGEYLNYELNLLIKSSSKLSITLIHEMAENCVINQGVSTIYSKNHQITTRFVVFSHGSKADPIFTQICHSESYIKDIYTDIEDIPAGSKILILGTSLSMVDAVILLSQLNNNYLITATSRNAYFPSIKQEYPDIQQGQNLLEELDILLKETKVFDINALIEFLDTNFSKFLGKPYSIETTLREYEQCLQRLPLILNDTLEQDSKALGFIYKYIDKCIEMAWEYLTVAQQHQFFEIKKYLLTIISGIPEINHNKLKNFLKDKNFSVEKLHHIDYKLGVFYAYFKSDIAKAVQYDYVLDCTGIKGYYTNNNSDLLAKNILNNKQIRISNIGKVAVNANLNAYYQDSDSIIPNIYAIGEVSHGPSYATGCFACYASQARLVAESIASQVSGLFNEK